MTSPPIFIVGSMRSGSTMLRLILDSHPNIAVPPETGFMGAVAATKVIPNWRFGEQWFTRLGWSEDEINHRIREFYAPMFERFTAQQGKSRWAEKTPFHVGHIPAMAEIFSDAVFVGIVRHAELSPPRCGRTSTTPFPTRCRTGQQPTLRWCGARRRSAAGSCSAVMKTWC